MLCQGQVRSGQVKVMSGQVRTGQFRTRSGHVSLARSGVKVGDGSA